MEPVRRVKVREWVKKEALVAPVKAVDKDKARGNRRDKDRVGNKVLDLVKVRVPEREQPGRRSTNLVMLRQSTKFKGGVPPCQVLTELAHRALGQ